MNVSQLLHRPRSKTPEGEVKAKVDKILKKYKIWYFKPVSGGMGKHGIPDYICCLRGRFIAIECKGTDAAKTTPLQDLRLSEIHKAGGATMVVRPCTLGGLEMLLERLAGDV